YEVGGDSIGLNILLPKEQTLNSYTTENYEFNHFFGRKVSLTLMASAYIYAPGGFGTLDELFEIITLKQTHRIPPIPVILLGSKFWNKLDDFIKETLRDEYKTIEAADRKTYEILDNHKTILKRIDDYTNEQLNKR
ncbi:MAG TPA: LOG family protein, partial [Candidatus Saccharibacteria bacterium]|nr:LOG family protein [Candidatus Saccharibacteria bacterium]